MGSTRIEWADQVWNPVTGCTPCAVGCAHCYARRMAFRLRGRFGYPADEPFRVTFHRDRLDEPQRWRKPRRVFVCSMSDLWHPDVLPEDRAAVIRATNLAPQHTYLFLTKRPERLDVDFSGSPNLWIGTSCSTQADVDRNVPHLLRCPARVRFLSLEPLLETVRLDCIEPGHGADGMDCLRGGWHQGDGRIYEPTAGRIRLVIAGCESGPRRRPVSLDAFRSLRDQCQAAGVPYFLKQAEIDGRLVKMPELDGRTWFEMPKEAK